MRKRISLLVTCVLFLCLSSSVIEAAPKKAPTKAKADALQIAPMKKKPRKTQVQKLEERIAALEQVVLLLIGANTATSEEGEAAKDTEKEPPMSEEASHMYI